VTPESLRTPQLEPADVCYTILQDHGASHGGWGPAAIVMPPLIPEPVPFIYTGSDTTALAGLFQTARRLAEQTGKETRLVCFHNREDLATYGKPNA
jgi:hypothetical protein